MVRRTLPLCLLGLVLVVVALLGVGGVERGPACASRCGSGSASLTRGDADPSAPTACLHAEGCGGGGASTSNWQLVAPDTTTGPLVPGATLVLVIGFVALLRQVTSLDPAGRLFRPPRLAA